MWYVFYIANRSPYLSRYIVMYVSDVTFNMWSASWKHMGFTRNAHFSTVLLGRRVDFFLKNLVWYETYWNNVKHERSMGLDGSVHFVGLVPRSFLPGICEMCHPESQQRRVWCSHGWYYSKLYCWSRSDMTCIGILMDHSVGETDRNVKRWLVNTTFNNRSRWLSDPAFWQWHTNTSHLASTPAIQLWIVPSTIAS